MIDELQAPRYMHPNGTLMNYDNWLENSNLSMHKLDELIETGYLVELAYNPVIKEWEEVIK